MNSTQTIKVLVSTGSYHQKETIVPKGLTRHQIEAQYPGLTLELSDADRAILKNETASQETGILGAISNTTPLAKKLRVLKATRMTPLATKRNVILRAAPALKEAGHALIVAGSNATGCSCIADSAEILGGLPYVHGNSSTMEGAMTIDSFCSTQAQRHNQKLEVIVKVTLTASEENPEAFPFTTVKPTTLEAFLGALRPDLGPEANQRRDRSKAENFIAVMLKNPLVERLIFMAALDIPDYKRTLADLGKPQPFLLAEVALREGKPTLVKEQIAMDNQAGEALLSF